MSTPSPGAGPDGGFEGILADAHSGYHHETRLHREPDVLVDDVVTYRMLAPHLMRAGLFLVAPTVLLLVWLLLAYLASMSSPDPVGSAIQSLLGFLVLVLYLAGVAAFFAPAKEPIAEYSQLLEGRGNAAATAYWWVRQAAAARRAPAEVRPSSVGGVPVLLFRQRGERAMLLVQAYGEDLYVGWTMWRSRSSATLLAHFLRDTFGRFAPSPRFSAELRAASTRALRESVHSLSREGVVAAVHAHAVGAQYGVDPRAAEADLAHLPDENAAGASAGGGPAAGEGARGYGGGSGELPQASPYGVPTTEAWTGGTDRVDSEELYAPRRGSAGWGPPPPAAGPR